MQPAPHPDEGLQPERTLLAWGRTLMAIAVTSLFLLRWLPRHGTLAVVIMTVALLGSFGLWTGQKRRYRRRVDAINHPRFAADSLAVFGLSLLVSVLGLGALWIVA